MRPLQRNFLLPIPALPKVGTVRLRLLFLNYAEIEENTCKKQTPENIGVRDVPTLSVQIHHYEV